MLRGTAIAGAPWRFPSKLCVTISDNSVSSWAPGGWAAIQGFTWWDWVGIRLEVCGELAHSRSAHGCPVVVDLENYSNHQVSCCGYPPDKSATISSVGSESTAYYTGGPIKLSQLSNTLWCEWLGLHVF